MTSRTEVMACVGMEGILTALFMCMQDCVDLIEVRPPAGVGILSLLDEECLFPKVHFLKIAEMTS
jgi:hypothetical protein